VIVVADLVDRLLAGDVRALARAISLVEDGAAETADILRRVYPRTGQAWVVGVTGPPGAGKSSLVDGLATAWRAAGERVGIVAVDPSSAFSGGAILGDRIRMGRHGTDPDVFIRSMANRGHPGGLSKATHDAVDLIDAAGYGIVLLETVGVGQDEIEVVEGADTVCVVLVPGMGDDVQSLKAGIMEIAHIFVINKADREGADRVAADVDGMLSLADWTGRWRPRTVATVALTGRGIAELVAGVAEHRSTALGASTVRRRALSRTRFLNLLREQLLREAARRVGEATLEAAITEIAERRTDPYTASDRVVRQACAPGSGWARHASITSASPFAASPPICRPGSRRSDCPRPASRKSRRRGSAWRSSTSGGRAWSCSSPWTPTAPSDASSIGVAKGCTTSVSR